MNLQPTPFESESFTYFPHLHPSRYPSALHSPPQPPHITNTSHYHSPCHFPPPLNPEKNQKGSESRMLLQLIFYLSIDNYIRKSRTSRQERAKSARGCVEQQPRESNSIEHASGCVGFGCMESGDAHASPKTDWMYQNLFMYYSDAPGPADE